MHNDSVKEHYINTSEVSEKPLCSSLVQKLRYNKEAVKKQERDCVAGDYVLVQEF